MRHDFTAPGQVGCCPLAAALNLPARCYADLLRAWTASGATDESYRERQTVIARILGLSRSLQAIETAVMAAAGEVTSFDERQAEPAPPPAATMLVVQADGQGVPMVQPPTQRPSLRLAKGQQRPKQKAAVVTARYTIRPYQRTHQEVVAARRQEPSRPAGEARPRPIGKARHAPREGQAAARSRLTQRVAHRDGPPIHQPVALTEGAEARPQQVLTHVPECTVSLDSIHAMESLWDTAHGLRGETQPPRPTWVRAYREALLAGPTDAVLTALEAAGHDPTHTATPRQAVRRTVGYYRRNRPSMRDDEYLARGWPMGTGVVEGACGHLGQDRLEQAGMRWTKAGAQAVLDLRAVRLNGHWEAYGPFHQHQPHRQVYGRSSPTLAWAEAHALEWAA